MVASEFNECTGNLDSQNVALVAEENEACMRKAVTSGGWGSLAVLTTLWEQCYREREEAFSGLAYLGCLGWGCSEDLKQWLPRRILARQAGLFVGGMINSTECFLSVTC